MMTRLESRLKLLGVNGFLWRSMTSVPPKPLFEGPIPPKRSLNPYIAFCEERLVGTGKREGLKLAVKEWKEMNPQDKEKYKEKSKELKEKYEKELQLFSQKFASEDDLKLYLKKYSEYCKNLRSYKSMKKEKKKPRKVSVLDAMKIDRCSKLPPEKRYEYVQKEVSIQYKNLTQEEKKKYKEMADEIYEEKMRRYKELKQLAKPC